jgi:hypothetical protein
VSADDFIVVPAAAAGAAGVAALKQLLADLAGDATRVKSLVGTPDAPRRAVLTLSPEEAQTLSQRYAGRLLLERNAALHPFSSSTKKSH